MHSCSDEALDRIRTPLQALMDLMVKQENMEANHPGRRELGLMIEQLAAEIAFRKGREDRLQSAA